MGNHKFGAARNIRHNGQDEQKMDIAWIQPLSSCSTL
jgi:hypothetical protein